MADSLSNWLALREPYDSRARSAALTDALAVALPRERELRVLDLGTGTGSNLRYLVNRLPHRQRWLLVDRDADLLEELPRWTLKWAAANGYEALDKKEGVTLRREAFTCELETRCADLGSLDANELFTGRDLVTGSALLDLVSERWLRELALKCRESRVAVLFALTYNGHSRCSPVEPEDDFVRGLVNQHQKTNDKGFGPAAGPDAVECAVRAFSDVGYDVRRESSDWVLPPDARDLQRQLITGWAEAATEIAPAQSSAIANWLARRLAHVDSNHSQVIVGHEDLAAFLQA